MPKNKFSPEYMARRKKLGDSLAGLSRDAIAVRMLALETAAKTAQASEKEARKTLIKYQGILSRLSSILTASTCQYKSGKLYKKEGRELPFSYEIAFRNCRVIIADYYEDIKFCNPAGYTKGSAGQKQRNDAKRKLRRLRA